MGTKTKGFGRLIYGIVLILLNTGCITFAIVNKHPELTLICIFAGIGFLGGLSCVIGFFVGMYNNKKNDKSRMCL